MTTNSPAMKEAKHLFMTFRNGIVADTLRNAGMPYKIIFGLQLPQISNTAQNLREKFTPEETAALASALWEDRNVRESRLLACYLFPADALSIEDARRLAEDVQTNEEADILCFRLLRRLPFAGSLAESLSGYCGVALRRNLS